MNANGDSMSEEMKKLLEELSAALGEAVKDSAKVRDLLRKIEKSSSSTNLTLAVVLGARDRKTEIQKFVYGFEGGQEKKGSLRRVSAFDRRFLRALRIRLPD